MNGRNCLHRANVRRIAACFLAALGMMSLAACGAADEQAPFASKTGDENPGAPELIGGEPARAEQFRTTVAIGDSCTAAKVGARLFLTAAHCVALGRPLRGMPPPENFPANDGVADDYLPGRPLLIHWGLDVSDGKSEAFTIARTSIHPSWWSCPLCQDPILANGAADIAVIEISEDTPEIPQARVELAKIPTGAQVVKVGWGCEQRTNIDAGDAHLGRFKVSSASIIPVSEIRRYDSRISDDVVAAVDAAYLVTAGHDQAEASASLCLGDSGGPLYLSGDGEPRIVGVNSDYSFRPVEPPDLGGVSWADWHTRTSLNAGDGIGQWLRDSKVNTVVSN